jgi:hypothetical protein
MIHTQSKSQSTRRRKEIGRPPLAENGAAHRGQTPHPKKRELAGGASRDTKLLEKFDVEAKSVDALPRGKQIPVRAPVRVRRTRREKKGTQAVCSALRAPASETRRQSNQARKDRTGGEQRKDRTGGEQLTKTTGPDCRTHTRPKHKRTRRRTRRENKD